MATQGLVGLEPTMTSEPEALALTEIPAEVAEIDRQLLDLRHTLQRLEDRAARRGRRTDRAAALRTEVAIAEDELANWCREAETVSSSLARWILRRGPSPGGSIADRTQEVARCETRLTGLKARLHQAERELDHSDASARETAASVAPRLRRLLERRLEVLEAALGPSSELCREAAYELAVCLRKGIGWLEQVCSHLEGLRRHVDAIASACAPSSSLLHGGGLRRRRRTPTTVQEDYLLAERLYRDAGDAAHAAQLSLGLMLGVPYRSAAFEELDTALSNPREALQLATLARWEVSHRLGEAAALSEAIQPQVRELDRRASP